MRNDLITEDTIASAFYLSKASYESVLSKPPEGFNFNKEVFPSTFSGSFGGHFDDTMRAVYYNSTLNSNTIYVSFRGSDNHANWLENAGFLNNKLPSVYKKFADNVISDLQVQFPDKNIIFTGHSAGAAMCIYASLITGFPCIGFDAPSVGISKDNPNWPSVHLYQAGSILSGDMYQDIENIGALVDLETEGNLFTSHKMKEIQKALLNWLDNTGRLSNGMGFNEIDLNNLSTENRSKINQLIAHFSHEAKLKNAKERIVDAKHMYQEIYVMSQQLDSRGLSRIASGGAVFLNLHESLLAFNINLPILSVFTQISSYLNPIVGLISAGMAVFSFFGRSRRQNANNTIDLAPVIQAIQNLHQEMRDSFQQVFCNQKLIIDTIVNQVNYLSRFIDKRVDDVVAPVMYSLEQANNQVFQLHNASFRKDYYRAVDELEELVHAAERYIENAPNLLQINGEKIYKLAIKLETWLTTRPASKIYNGQVFLQHDSVDISTSFLFNIDNDTDNLLNLIGYFIGKSKSLLNENFSDRIDCNKIINPFIWISACKAYISLRKCLSEKHISYDSGNIQLSKIISYAENTSECIQFLRYNSTLYKMLFDQYIQTANNIKEELSRICISYGFGDIHNDLIKAIHAHQFHCDEKNFSIIDKKYQDMILPIYTKFELELEKRSIEKNESFKSAIQLMGSLVSKRDEFKVMLSLLSQNLNVNQTQQNKLMTSVLNGLKIPVNSFAEVDVQGVANYKIPIEIGCFLSGIKIPLACLLAEIMGVLQFNISCKWHSNPNAFHHGMRQGNDQYRYSFTVSMVIEDKIFKFCTFDCVGSLLDSPETAFISELHNTIHSYWYSNYNVHLGGGRYAPNSVGYAMTPIMYAVSIIGPFLGRFPEIVPESIQYHEEINLNKLTDLISSQLDGVLSNVAKRLTGLPNTDWTALQPLFKRAKEIGCFLRACIKVSGFSQQIMDQLPLLSEDQLDNQTALILLPDSLRKKVYGLALDEDNDLHVDFGGDLKKYKESILLAIEDANNFSKSQTEQSLLSANRDLCLFRDRVHIKKSSNIGLNNWDSKHLILFFSFFLVLFSYLIYCSYSRQEPRQEEKSFFCQYFKLGC